MLRIEMQNWGERNPRSDYKSIPWFRMDSDFYRNKKLFGLTVEAKWLWVSLLGLAARENKGGVVEADRDWIASELQTSTKALDAALEALASKGLVVCRTLDVRDANGSRTDPVAGRSLHTNGTERNETNEHVESTSSKPADAGAPNFLVTFLFDTWNANHGPLSRCTVLNDSRRRKSKARWTEKPDPAYWAMCVQKMAASSFCASGTWATFDWLIANDTNHVKVAEGKYDNRGSGDTTGMSEADWAKVFEKGGTP